MQLDPFRERAKVTPMPVGEFFHESQLRSRHCSIKHFSTIVACVRSVGQFATGRMRWRWRKVPAKARIFSEITPRRSWPIFCLTKVETRIISLTTLMNGLKGFRSSMDEERIF